MSPPVVNFSHNLQSPQRFEGERRRLPCPARLLPHTLGCCSRTLLQTSKCLPPDSIKPLMSLTDSGLLFKVGQAQALQACRAQPSGGFPLGFPLRGLGTALHPSPSSCPTCNNLKPSRGHLLLPHREQSWYKKSVLKR